MPLEKRTFGKGVDTDTELRLIQNGTSRSQKNVRTFSISGNNFCVENVKGTTLISYALPDGINETKGRYDDIENNRVFYFVWNSGDDHLILSYDYRAGTITKILGGEGLSFTRNNLITSVALIDDSILVFTDSNSEVKVVDINGYLAGTDISNEYLVALAKPSPSFGKVEYATNSDYKGNNLRGNMFKFSLIYVYKGGYRSVLGERSKVPLPVYESTDVYNNSNPSYFDNQLNITINNAPSEVESIELYASYGGDDMSMSDWYLIAKIEADQAPTVYTFLNDGAYPVLDAVEAAQTQTNIPKKVQALEYVSSNRLVFANITEDFNIADYTPLISVTPQYAPAPSTSPTTSTVTASLVNDKPASGLISVSNAAYNIKISSEFNNVLYDEITIGGTAQEGDKIDISLSLTYNIFSTFSGAFIPYSKTVSTEYIVKDTDTLSDIAIGVSAAINGVDTTYFTAGGVVAVVSGLKVEIYQGQNVNNLPTLAFTTVAPTITITGTTPSAYTVKTFKRFSKIPAAIQYMDYYGRKTSAIPIGDVNVLGQSETTNKGAVSLSVSIDNEALANMAKYTILLGQQQTYEAQIYYSGIVQNVSTNKWKIDIPNQIASFNAENQNSILSYTFQRGDRIRMIGYFTTITAVTYFSEQLALEITKSEDDGGSVKLYFDFDAASITPSFGNNDYLLCEVYRPKKNVEDIFYYETGLSLDVEFSNGRWIHKGVDQDQIYGVQPALFDLNGIGNAYYKQRTFNPTTGRTFFVEDFNYSDFYNSKVSDIGRPNVINAEEREINRETTMYFTQPYIPDTKVNGLANVFSTSFKDYDDRYGEILRIVQRDRYLLTFQKDKIGYVGLFMETAQSESGNMTFDTTQLLNTMEYYNYNTGISHAESLYSFGNSTYFVDTKRNIVGQLSGNGITPVQQFSFQKRIADQSALVNGIKINGNVGDMVKVWGACDAENAEYVVCYDKSWSAAATIIQNVSLGQITVNTSDLQNLLVGDSIIIEYVRNDNSVLGQFSTVVTLISEDVSTQVVGFAAIGIPESTTSRLIVKNRNTYSFNYEGNYWNDEIEYDAECLSGSGVKSLGFKNGALYQHGTNETRGLLYGSQKNAEVEVIFNSEPSSPKIFRNIQLESNKVWVSDENGDIYTLEGQQSLLASNHYKKRLNQWFGAFLRDSNSVNVDSPLLQGNKLLSTVLSVKLKNSDTEEVKMFRASVGYIPSNLSNYNV
jgi:hypothetical protein